MPEHGFQKAVKPLYTRRVNLVKLDPTTFPKGPAPFSLAAAQRLTTSEVNDQITKWTCVTSTQICTESQKSTLRSRIKWRKGKGEERRKSEPEGKEGRGRKAQRERMQGLVLSLKATPLCTWVWWSSALGSYSRYVPLRLSLVVQAQSRHR